MTKDAQQQLVVQFNDSINRRDLQHLADLMSSDHTFIDTAGRAIRGKEEALKAWRGFFAAFPDYENTFELLTTQGNLVVAVGRSSCSDRLLDGPALWTARVDNENITEWRVLEDTPENRRQMGIEAGQATE